MTCCGFQPSLPTNYQWRPETSEFTIFYLPVSESTQRPSETLFRAILGYLPTCDARWHAHTLGFMCRCLIAFGGYNGKYHNIVQAFRPGESRQHDAQELWGRLCIWCLDGATKDWQSTPLSKLFHGMHSAHCLLSAPRLLAGPCTLSTHLLSARLSPQSGSPSRHAYPYPCTCTKPAAGMKSHPAPKSPVAQPKPIQQQPHQKPQQPRSTASPSKQPAAADAAPSDPQQQQQGVGSAGDAAGRAASEQQQYQRHLEAASAANAALREKTAASSKQTEASVQGQWPACLQLPWLYWAPSLCLSGHAAAG